MRGLWEQEMRGAYLGMPQRYQALDFLGVGMGIFLLWAGLTGKASRESLIILGLIAFGIHSQRFLFAPQDPEKLERLLESVGLKRTDICQ